MAEESERTIRLWVVAVRNDQRLELEGDTSLLVELLRLIAPDVHRQSLSGDWPTHLKGGGKDEGIVRSEQLTDTNLEEVKIV